MTVGVMHRIDELKTRNPKSEIRNKNSVRWVYPKEDGRSPYVSLVPLAEIISEVVESAPKTKKVMDIYNTLVDNLGSEFSVLLKASLDEISKYAAPKVVEGIAKVRSGEIKIEPGYDGKFGVVEIWDREEAQASDAEPQLNLFA